MEARAGVRATAFFYITVSCVVFGFLGLFANFLKRRGISVAQMIYVRCVFTIVATTYMILRQKDRFYYDDYSLNAGLYARAIVGSISMDCFFFACTIIPLGEAITLESVSPILTVFLA